MRKRNHEQWASNYERYHQNRYTTTIDIVDNYEPDGIVLDVGSAPFHLTNRLDNIDYEVIGIDRNPNRLGEYIRQNELQIITLDIERCNFPFEDNSVEFIIFTEVLEHLYVNPLHTLREMNRILVDDGHLLLSTPNLYSIFNIGKFCLGRGLTPVYDEFKKFEDLGHRGHIRIYSMSEIEEMLTEVGLKTVSKEHHQFEYEKFGQFPIRKNIAHFVLKIFPQLSDTNIIIAQ